MNNPFRNILSGWEKFQALPLKTLSTIRNLLIWAMMGDLFLFFYLYPQKLIGTFLFIMILIFISLCMVAEKNQGVDFPSQEPPKKEKREVRPKKKEEGYENQFGNTLDDLDNTIKEIKKDLQQGINTSYV